MTTRAYAVSEGQRFAGDTNLRVESCPDCHITYAIPESLYRAAQRYTGGRSRGGWDVYCPMGHVWHYTGQNYDEKLKRAQDRAACFAAERDQALASARAQRGAATRARNERDRARRRMANGVCPCCGRTFKQVARHMRSQHPDFVIEAHSA